MHKSFLYIALSVFVISACGTTKEMEDASPKVSKADYPYIQTFHEGLRLKTKGRSEEAIAKFETCLTMRQDDDALYYALSKLELERGNLDKSAEYIKKAAEIDPNNSWYVQELAYMYFEKEDYPNAIKHFKYLVEKQPKNVDWLYGYAEALVENGQEKEAIEVLNKTEDQTGKHPQFALQRYNLYMDMKDEESAEQELLNARKNFPQDANLIAYLVDHYFKTDRVDDGISMLKELVKADPGNGRAHLALADVYQQTGDTEKMYDEMRAAFRSPSLDVETKVKVLNSVHQSGVRIDPEMYELLDILVEVNPDYAGVFSTQGDYLLSANDEPGALQAYRRSLDLDQSEYAVWNQVLIMEYQAGEYESLYERSKACAELFPTMTTVFLLNGVSANQLGKYDEALESLIYGVELVGSDKPLKAEFHAQMAEAKFGTKDYTDGIVDYKKAIQLDPQSLLLKNNFAAALAEANKDLELAESLAQQTTEASPKNGLYQDTYGLVLFQKGKYEEAKKHFEMALALEGDDAVINEHLGDAYSKLGNKEEALKYWDKAKRLGSTNSVLEKKITDKKYYDPID
jgi:tetratricopeptide (TPR) repeat protein